MITFTVDGPLPKTEEPYNQLSANEIVDSNLFTNERKVIKYLHSSFESEKMIFLGKDSFFKSVLIAFQEHKSLILSPDMIWLKILQTVSRHINDNPEAYRDLTFVEHGKRALVIETAVDIFNKDVNWDSILDSFETMILQNINKDLGETISPDFSTTTPVEKIVSKITLMDMMKPYFEFVVRHYVCGIPTITLLGSPEDWKHILEKAVKLSIFSGLYVWIEELKPILKEFVNASKGKVKKTFWRSIVMKRHPKELHTGGCAPRNNPALTGWILKFYPFDHDADTLNNFEPNRSMKSEIMAVPWYYTLYNDVKSTTFPMEFWAGFVGTRFDEEKDAFTPAIGWFVRQVDSDKELAEAVEAKFWSSRDIHLNLNGKVPMFLKEIRKLDALFLDFCGDFVNLPEWMDTLQIDSLTVYGRYHRGDKTKLRARFPHATFE